MKQKSEEVRQRILKCAEENFIQKGFRDSSMRELVKKSGISYGNIYKYFANKEDILTTLITPFIKKIQQGFNDTTLHSSAPENTRTFTQGIAQGLTVLYNQNRNHFLIFFLKMKGSKLDHYRIELTNSLMKHMMEVVDNQNLACIFAEQFFSTIAKIADSSRNTEDFSKSIEQYVNYHMKGMSSF